MTSRNLATFAATSDVNRLPENACNLKWWHAHCDCYILWPETALAVDFTWHWQDIGMMKKRECHSATMTHDQRGWRYAISIIYACLASLYAIKYSHNNYTNVYVFCNKWKLTANTTLMHMFLFGWNVDGIEQKMITSCTCRTLTILKTIFKHKPFLFSYVINYL